MDWCCWLRDIRGWVSGITLNLKGGTEYQHYDFIEWACSVWDGVTGFPWQRDGRAGDTLDYLHNLLTRPNAKCGPCINSFPVKWNKEGVASGGKGWIRGTELVDSCISTSPHLEHRHMDFLHYCWTFGHCWVDEMIADQLHSASIRTLALRTWRPKALQRDLLIKCGLNAFYSFCGFRVVIFIQKFKSL